MPQDGVPNGAKCSFAGDTLVLMADGTRKPIKDIRIGDWVLATDPETGEQVAKRVTHLWVHHDDLTELVLNIDADGDGVPGRLVTTAARNRARQMLTKACFVASVILRKLV